ncbi:hypothetical protein ACVWZV_003417 [Bradyrhizobium sp. GM5.1]
MSDQETRATTMLTVAPFERGEIGPELFWAACRMGLEGLVSKHRDRPYRGGRQKHWIKVKNRRQGRSRSSVAAMPLEGSPSFATGSRSGRKGAMKAQVKLITSGANTVYRNKSARRSRHSIEPHQP